MSRRGKRETLTPELTPLIDVVFLLLIFFMVSSVFKKQELSLDLKLPETQTGKAGGKKLETVTIELTGSSIAFQGETVKIEELEVKLKALSKKDLMNLRVDGKVQYNRLVKVLELLQKYKLNNLSLITDKK
jgi:biopolymer transport protein ExbD